MEPLPVDVIQLQRRDPAAWTTLLSQMAGPADVIVTAVSSEPVWNTLFFRPGRLANDPSRRVRRFTLTLAGCSDPITFIAKRSTPIEADVYHRAGARMVNVIPPCHYNHRAGDHSWLILEDVPNDIPTDRWTPGHIDRVVESLAAAHLSFWNESSRQTNIGRLTATGSTIDHFLQGEGMPYTWDELRDEHSTLFDEGPGAILSEHAIRNAGRLAPALLEAANGLVVMRDLGGWPGVLGESHLAAVADLLDDPVPMLEALANLPVTLLHGSPHPYHWRVTVFDEYYLVDWSEARLGPGVLDLISFIEHYPLIYFQGGRDITSYHPPAHGAEPLIRLREMTPLTEETLIDTYLLAMSSGLGGQFPARAFRAAVPAARCLHVLTTWFAYFGSWFAEMPDRYTWQRVNRMSEAELAGTMLGPMTGVRPYLAGVFDRFLRAYRSL
jgi:hypothetical protein